MKNLVNILFLIILCSCNKSEEFKIYPEFVQCNLKQEVKAPASDFQAHKNEVAFAVSKNLPIPKITGVLSHNPSFGNIVYFDYEEKIADYFYVMILQLQDDGEESQKAFFALNNKNRATDKKTLSQLGITDEKLPIKIRICAHLIDLEIKSEYVETDWIDIRPKEIAKPEYQWRYKIVTEFGYDENGEYDPNGGFTKQEFEDLDFFLSDIEPDLRDLVGPVAVDGELKVYKNLSYVNTAAYQPLYHCLYLGDYGRFDAQLYAHEAKHGWTSEFIGTKADGTFSVSTAKQFETSAAGIASMIANRFYGRNGKTAFVPYPNNSSFYGYNLDLKDQDYLRGKDLWADGNGMGRTVEMYFVGGAYIEKIERSNPGTHKRFYESLHNYINSVGLKRNKDFDCSSVMEFYSQVGGEVEGIPLVDFMKSKPIFDCEDQYGKQIYNRSFQYLDPTAYTESNEIYYYEVKANGNIWADGDDRHNLNGSKGIVAIFDYNDDLFYLDSLLLEPIENPPAYQGFGKDYLNISSKKENQRHEDALIISELGRYKIQIQFENTVYEDYRVFGSELENLEGIAGYTTNAKSGQLVFTHESFLKSDTLEINNYAFAGKTQWAAQYDEKSRQLLVVPGNIEITYLPENSDSIQIENRYVFSGDNRGNMLFAFDFTDEKKENPSNDGGDEVVVIDSLDYRNLYLKEKKQVEFCYDALLEIEDKIQQTKNNLFISK